MYRDLFITKINKIAKGRAALRGSLECAYYSCSPISTVATIPTDEEGVGSARYWACTLATALNKDHFIMLDDSYYHEANEIIRLSGNNDARLPLLCGVQFLEKVFSRTEYLVERSTLTILE